MVRYSIKDLENFTQIKAHTIRIWEQRYKLFTPKRTDTNIRYYSEEDLKKILNINLLYQNGLKISKIAKLTDSEIIEQAKVIIENDESNDSSTINPIIIAICEMDASSILNQLSEQFNTLGVHQFYTKIISPVLVKIGKLWQVNSLSISHEHLFSHLLRDFIICKTYELKQPENPKGRILFLLHENEEHELSLLFFRYLYLVKGYHTVYLGQSLPIASLKESIHQINPDLVVTSFIAQVSPEELNQIIKNLTEFVSIEKIKINGFQAIALQDQLPEGIELLTPDHPSLN